MKKKEWMEERKKLRKKGRGGGKMRKRGEGESERRSCRERGNRKGSDIG